MTNSIGYLVLDRGFDLLLLDVRRSMLSMFQPVLFFFSQIVGGMFRSFNRNQTSFTVCGLGGGCRSQLSHNVIKECACACMHLCGFHHLKASQPGLFVVKLTHDLFASVYRKWEVVVPLC